MPRRCHTADTAPLRRVRNVKVRRLECSKRATGAPEPRLPEREGRSAGRRRRPLATTSRGDGDTTQSRLVSQASRPNGPLLGHPSPGVYDAGGRRRPRGKVGRSVWLDKRPPAPRHRVPGTNIRTGTAAPHPIEGRDEHRGLAADLHDAPLTGGGGESRRSGRAERTSSRTADEIGECGRACSLPRELRSQKDTN